MVEMAKQPFHDPEELFSEEAPMQYSEAKFLSYLAKVKKVDQNAFAKGEQEKYNEALKKLERFSELHSFIDNMSEFYWELETLYLETQREINTSNFWSRREKTTHVWEEQSHESVRKYIKLMQELQDYPEWQAKVKNEIGYQVHLIYQNLTGTTVELEKFFEDFDKQYFFK